ncbi:MAG: ABC transporter substrate-binding protein [Nocardioidaceae bacterium]
MTQKMSRPVSQMIAVGSLVALALAGCTNSGSDESGSSTDPSPSDGGGEQVVQTPTADAGGTAKGCTLQEYGAEKIDLASATVGFSQSEPDTAAFRAAETQSIKDAAKEVGVKELLVTNANAELPRQISDIQDMLNQGAQFLIVAPVNSDGLDPALNAAKDAGVPVLTIDRKITNKPCEDYIAFLGSNFVEQGKRAADALAEATDEKANVAILLGSSGNNVTDDRTSGFKDQLAAEYPEMKVVAEQTGNFARDEGQAVTEQLLASNPEIDAIYAENDEMGVGAVTAITSAGLEPGTDVKIVSIDGIKDAVQLLADGKYNGVIESNPRFGPLAFETAQQFYDGEPIPEDVIIEDKEYTPENASSELPNAF